MLSYMTEQPESFLDLASAVAFCAGNNCDFGGMRLDDKDDVDDWNGVVNGAEPDGVAAV